MIDLNELREMVEREPVTGNMVYGLPDEAERERQLHIIDVTRELLGDTIPTDPKQCVEQGVRLHGSDNPIPSWNPVVYIEKTLALADRYLDPGNRVSYRKT